MTVLLSQSEHTNDKLKLFLSDDQGRPSDAFSVCWTIQTCDGRIVSGEHIPAVKKTTGAYYPTWISDVPTGSYRVLWEYKLNELSEIQYILQPFYVIEPSSKKHHINRIIKEHPPALGSLVFLPYSYLGPNDLFIIIKDENNCLSNVYSINWRIQDEHGHHHALKSSALQAGIGHYFAPWIAIAKSGGYKIIWEYQATATAPLQRASQNFSILGHGTFFSIVPGSVNSTKFIVSNHDKHKFCVPYEQGCISMPDRFSGCGSHHGSRPFVNPCSPNHSVFPPFPIVACCDYEIPRQIHLPTTVLSVGGVFTNQSPFSIPTRIKKITFYVQYTSASPPNGFAAFRLFWGNGVEDTQETVFDADMNQEDSAHVFQSFFIQDLHGPIPVDNNPISFVLSTTVPGGVTTVRLVAAEGGVPVSPGTVTITLTAST
jgi:hypothetical protein